MAADPPGPVIAVADLLRTFPRPWFIAGGWAIDLFVGRTTRPHEDVDVAILRTDQNAIRAHLAGWTFDKVDRGQVGPWKEGEWLYWPHHEIHAHRAGGEPTRLEILLNDATGGLWRFRRHLDVVRPLDRLGIPTPSGIPVLAPEIVLLYKSKTPTAKDERDFEAALPGLDREAREWLRIALETCHPGHPWAARVWGSLRGREESTSRA